MKLEDIRKEWNIPEITKEKLNELYSFIKPVIREGEQLFKIKDVEPTQCFTWAPEIIEEVEDLIKVDKIYFLSSSYPGFWKPSIDEILCLLQDRKDINELKYIEVSFMEHHKSGMGNIGLAKIYK